LYFSSLDTRVIVFYFFFTLKLFFFLLETSKEKTIFRTLSLEARNYPKPTQSKSIHHPVFLTFICLSWSEWQGKV